jgi:hypothetical protein
LAVTVAIRSNYSTTVEALVVENEIFLAEEFTEIVDAELTAVLTIVYTIAQEES